MAVKHKLTTPEQHLAFTGIEIDWYYITSFWDSNNYEPAGSEIYGTYNTLEEAQTALIQASQN